METEGVEHSISFPGLNALQFTNTPNTGVAFLPLEPFDQRERSAAELNAEINSKIGGLQEGFTFSIMPPPILGLGNGNGYQMFIEDRGNLGYGALQTAVSGFQGAIAQRSEEHTSELQSLMRISYAVFCLNKKNTDQPRT